MSNTDIFTFKGYTSDLAKGEAVFTYELFAGQKKTTFNETITFSPVASTIPPALLSRILNNLLLAFGISYWKTYCPTKIEITPFSLTKEEASFWNTVYTKGLGEFFYENKIDYHGLVNFPWKDNTPAEPVSFPRQDRALVPLGGGKDSIVTAQLLKEHNKPFDLLTFSTSSVQEAVASVIEKTPIVIKRSMDKMLFELNEQQGVYNGHIPISAIYAFISIFAAILYDYKYVIVSNEKSANYGNVEYLGDMINHQWSKSLEFEELFREYIKLFVTMDVEYFSLLRPLHEIKIVEIFSKYKQYFGVFSSCNTNFTVFKDKTNKKWCCKCPKCLFVFTMLVAFLSKQEVVAIFGENLFANNSLLPLFKELLGLEKIKPFECVGTPSEMKLALEFVLQKKEYEGDPLISFYKDHKKENNEKKELLLVGDTKSLPETYRDLFSDI